MPKAGFSPRNAARAVVRSESEGGVRVSDIPNGKPRLDSLVVAREGEASVGICRFVSFNPTFSFKKLCRRILPAGLKSKHGNATLRIHSHLDKRLRSYASCELLMGGENDSFKLKAFFRSLLAFHEEGLYEVPYMPSTSFFFTMTWCIPRMWI